MGCASCKSDRYTDYRADSNSRLTSPWVTRFHVSWTTANWISTTEPAPKTVTTEPVITALAQVTTEPVLNPPHLTLPPNWPDSVVTCSVGTGSVDTDSVVPGSDVTGWVDRGPSNKICPFSTPSTFRRARKFWVHAKNIIGNISWRFEANRNGPKNHSNCRCSFLF